MNEVLNELKSVCEDAVMLIENLERRAKDNELLYHAFFVLAKEAGVPTPTSTQLIEAAKRFDERLKELES